jgi:hypothetical protein
MNSDKMFMMRLVLIIIAVVGALWFHYTAPCSWFSWAYASELPARCLEGKR